jgi:hypothetical protein
MSKSSYRYIDVPSLLAKIIAAMICLALVSNLAWCAVQPWVKL